RCRPRPYSCSCVLSVARLNAIVDQNSLEADDDRVRAYLEEMAAGYDDPEQMVSYYYRNEEQLNNIRNVVLEDQVMDLILESAQSTEIAQSYEEAMAPPPPPEMSDDTDSGDDASDTADDVESTNESSAESTDDGTNESTDDGTNESTNVTASEDSEAEQGAAQEKPDAAT
ncbi:MAG: hypothetical protein AAF525_21985, partial [Pseudomonadota bacterium]